MNRREHRRVRLRLPVRLRWIAPFSQKIELCETIDVSRSGLLVSTKAAHTAGVPLAVTFPYETSLSGDQPEILARVVRCLEVLDVVRSANARAGVQTEGASLRERSAKLDQIVRAIGVSDVPATFAVGIQFETHTHAASNGGGHRREPERRASSRRALAVPVRVRPEGIPWFEETMTMDFSARGMRFRSRREYQPGDTLNLAFDAKTSTPWPGSGEFRSRVVRVSPVPDSFALDVCICRLE